MNGRVLLTDAQQRKTLAAIRSLGKKGVEVIAAEETRWATSLFSRYCGRALVSPNPARRPEEYFIWLEGVLRKHPCDVLFPMDDGSMEVAVRYRGQLERLCRLPIPRDESYFTAADKARAVMAAREAGLDCPETIVLKSLDELDRAASSLAFPVVIKPRKSSGSRGIVAVQRKEDLAGQYLKVHREYPFPLIQEYINPGEKFDVCLLFDYSSRLKASFVQREVRCFPPERGPSTVQESVWRPDLVEMAAHLMRKLNWQGVAEVEFMVDPRNGRAVFMEVNPRFWGSLHTAILAGVDFPWLLYRLAVDGDVKEVSTYTAGVRCRWLLPGDILHFIYNKNRFSMDPPFFSTRNSGLHDDIVSLEDPLPALGFFLACLRYVFDPGMWKLMFFR